MLLTPRQAAEKAGISDKAIYAAIKDSRLSVTTIAGRIFVDDMHLKDLIASPRFRKAGRKPAAK